jgi:hypothetical protein
MWEPEPGDKLKKGKTYCSPFEVGDLVRGTGTVPDDGNGMPGIVIQVNPYYKVLDRKKHTFFIEHVCFPNGITEDFFGDGLELLNRENRCT